MSELGEDGGTLGAVGIDSARIVTLGVLGVVSEGTLRLAAPAGVDEAIFEGTSEPMQSSAELRGELGMEVVGVVGNGLVDG